VKDRLPSLVAVLLLGLLVLLVATTLRR